MAVLWLCCGCAVSAWGSLDLGLILSVSHVFSRGLCAVLAGVLAGVLVFVLAGLSGCFYYYYYFGSASRCIIIIFYLTLRLGRVLMCAGNPML